MCAKRFVFWTIRGVREVPFEYLSELHDQELCRALAVPARDDIRRLFGVASENSKQAAQKAVRGEVVARIQEMLYGFEAVTSGKLDLSTPAPTELSLRWAQDYLRHCVAMKEPPLEIDEDITGFLPKAKKNPPRLTELDYKNAANSLGVDLPAIKAVASVESSGGGFLADGRPTIRYELHRFQAKTGRHFHYTHPHLSQPTLAAGNPYHNGKQQREYSLLYSAMLLRYNGVPMMPQAIESTSWGMFQIMGENWSSLGWPSARAFASDMYVSEGNHLSAFVKFVQNKGLGTALKTHDWASFAQGYNGPLYAMNNYDANLKQAFRQNGGKD
jgi:hypothetical protein